MKHGNHAVALLTETDFNLAAEYATEIEQFNLDRREADKRITEEALKQIEDQKEQERFATVVYDETWHKGVIGIAASRIQDHYYRPTIILTESNGKASGSARSVLGFDVHAAIEKCSDLLTSFGGHPAAAGMTLELNLIDEFRTRFEKAVSETITDDQLIPSIEVDLEVNLDQLTMNFFNQIQRMAPFGPNNMTPVFVTHNLKDTGRSKCVGDGSHLKFEVTQDGADHKAFGGIGFGLGEHEKEVQKAKEEIENLKYEAEQAERAGDFGKVADIRYGKTKEAEEILKKNKHKPF